MHEVVLLGLHDKHERTYTVLGTIMPALVHSRIGTRARNEHSSIAYVFLS